MLSRSRLQALSSHFLLKSNFSSSASQHPKYNIEEIKETRSIILHPKKAHKYSLIWLHGLGDSAYGFVDVFLDQTHDIAPANCKVILLTAPERPVTMNDGMILNSWYDIKDIMKPSKTLDDLFEKYSQKEI